MPDPQRWKVFTATRSRACRKRPPKSSHTKVSGGGEHQRKFFLEQLKNISAGAEHQEATKTPRRQRRFRAPLEARCLPNEGAQSVSAQTSL